jgi:alkylation response protein AidB-like acyl-CoA dehydrogenase
VRIELEAEMTTETIDPTQKATDAAAILDAVRALTPLIAARGDEIERGRRLPPDLVQLLREAGCFRMLVPRRLGGAAAEFDAHAEMIRELARADGSVGWTVMIGSAAPVILGMLPPATVDEVYAEGPDVVGAGAFNPKGVATPVERGFRVSGRWPFASGCQHADWFIAHCMIDDGRMPPLRMMLLPPADVEIVDTWTVAGLCGTGSHDFTVDGVFVPDKHTFSIFEPGEIEGPLGQIPELLFSSLAMASVAIGIAEGALAEITTLATAKVPMFADSTLATLPLFRYRLGEMAAHLRAARALLDADIASTWTAAVTGAELTPERRAMARSTAVWVVTAAAEVVDAAYAAGGGTSLYCSSPLQRRLRDIHALTQHFAVKPDTFTLAGAVLAGQDVDLSFL